MCICFHKLMYFCQSGVVKPVIRQASRSGKLADRVGLLVEQASRDQTSRFVYVNTSYFLMGLAVSDLWYSSVKRKNTILLLKKFTVLTSGREEWVNSDQIENVIRDPLVWWIQAILASLRIYADRSFKGVDQVRRVLKNVAA